MKDLKAKYPNRLFKFIEIDFARQYQVKDIKTLYDSHLANLNISILFNNVSYAEGSKFSELSVNQIHTMMTVNCYTMTLLTKCVLDYFKRRFNGSKAKSLIVNHCAAASIAPMPYV
jgi:short-subunit dehydrogenase